MAFDWKELNLPTDVQTLLDTAPGYIWPSSAEELIDLACGGKDSDYTEVVYAVRGKGRVVEATVARVRNGVVANYPEPYMRRRDPDCMFIADSSPTDKVRFSDKFGYDFDSVRTESLEWLGKQQLLTFAFTAGRRGMGADALVVAPANAGFFAYGLAQLQGMIPTDELEAGWTPKAIIYVAPPFRHTHFEGRQVVVHNRTETLHELFAYNLYPGPSAKKGIYGVLLTLGEKEGWITAHGSTVLVTTPYDHARRRQRRRQKRNAGAVPPRAGRPSPIGKKHRHRRKPPPRNRARLSPEPRHRRHGAVPHQPAKRFEAPAPG
jgi:hypothetical protein